MLPTLQTKFIHTSYHKLNKQQLYEKQKQYGYLSVTYNAAIWFKQSLFIHRNRKLNKQQVQEKQKQYGYLSVNYNAAVSSSWCQHSAATVTHNRLSVNTKVTHNRLSVSGTVTHNRPSVNTTVTHNRLSVNTTVTRNRLSISTKSVAKDAT